MLQFKKRLWGAFRLYGKDKESKKRKQRDYGRSVCLVLHLCSNAAAAFGMDVYKFVQTQQ